MSDEWITTKAALLEHIKRDWQTLNLFLASLSDKQWSSIENEDGWTIKDHVAHLAAWEASALAILERKPRHLAFDIPESVYLSQDIDAINEALFEKHRNDDRSLVQERLYQGHQKILKKIEKLTDEDINKPYSHYLPDELGDNDFPTINAIYGNTAHHYRTHQVWMQQMIDNTDSSES